MNPAYDDAFDAFAPKEVHGKPAERQKWAVEQMMLAAKASKRLGLTAHPTFLRRARLAVSSIPGRSARPG